MWNIYDEATRLSREQRSTEKEVAGKEDGTEERISKEGITV
jgi:hypothetical protein